MVNSRKLLSRLFSAGLGLSFLASPFAFSESPLSMAEKQAFYHLSEGSDVYPYDWLIRIKSAYERERDPTQNRDFFEGIESRINVFYYPESNPYLLDYIGLTASWSGHGSQTSDAFKPTDAFKTKTPDPQLKWIGTTPSIRMMGINCAFCHVGSVKVGENFKIIDGSQGMVNVQRLYEDMIVSTIELLFNSDNQLEKFLIRFDYPQATAKKLAKEFAKQTLRETSFATKRQLIAKKIGIVKKLGPRPFEGEEKNIARHFERLLRLTHRLKPNQDIGNELKKKFQFLANFAGGSPKFTTQGETKNRARFHKANDGFTRLEAFVSAGNRAFRDRKDWVDVDSPVGLPAIWGVDKKAVFHYTGNTNATFVRNIGQALSLGAVLLDDEYRSAAKIENLVKLERYSARLMAPNWEDYFTADFVKGKEAEFKIKPDLVTKGQKHYQRLCASCHEPTLVGPNHDLEHYPFSNLTEIGTDPNLAKNAVKPVRKGVAYSSVFINTMESILETYQKDYPASQLQMSAWRESDKRGKEWIRESYQTNQIQNQGAADHFPAVPENSGYLARNLKGIWATAPYLHNNSVPTLWDLLQPSDRRPQLFERGINDFDPKKVGLVQRYASTDDLKGLSLGKTKKFDCKNKTGNFSDEVWKVDICFDTKLSGNSNRGHEYGVALNETQKTELIEYMKTLH